MGIPFGKNQGFPKLSPCYITTWKFPLQNICYNCWILWLKWTLRNIFYYIFSLVIICLNPIECNQLISKETILIKMMCKGTECTNLETPTCHMSIIGLPCSFPPGFYTRISLISSLLPQLLLSAMMMSMPQYSLPLLNSPLLHLFLYVV